jgi:endonuclease G
VIVVLPIGLNDLNRINVQTRVIAVRMPNINVAGDAKWNTFRTSIDAIEAEIGLDLLSNVPASIQQSLETDIDKTSIQSIYLTVP